MYVILCYDVGSKRLRKVNQTSKKYLHPVQKSVMEGNLTEKTLHRLMEELARLIDPEHDALSLYVSASAAAFSKEQIGRVTGAELTIL